MGVATLRHCAEVATKHEMAGSLELRECLRVSLDDGKFTQKEYMYFKKRQEEVESRHIGDSFIKGTFRYMEKDGIGINVAPPK